MASGSSEASVRQIAAQFTPRRSCNNPDPCLYLGMKEAKRWAEYRNYHLVFLYLLELSRVMRWPRAGESAIGLCQGENSSP